MRRIFNGTLAVLAIGAGLTVASVSCRDNATAPQLRAPDPDGVTMDRRVADLRAKTSFMGQFHTDALTYIASQLEAAKQTARTQADRCSVASKAFKDFTKAYRRDGAPLTLPADFESGLGCNGGAPVGTRPNIQIGSAGRLQPRNDDLSLQAQSYLSRIESAFDADVTLEQLVSNVNAIAAEAAGTLDYAAASAVFGTASIAVSSAKYWSTNSEAWVDGGSVPLAYSVLTQPLGYAADRMSPLGRFIMKADVSGAISSFVKDWWTGAASFEKAMIIGAAASAIAGISKFL
jgi:hypothetical protein